MGIERDVATAPADMQSYTTAWEKKVRFPWTIAAETDTPRTAFGPGGVLGVLPSGPNYFAGAAVLLPGVSFGGTPMILTPAPRATSIASMMSPYFTPGTPLTKMIFSGRGS